MGVGDLTGAMTMAQTSTTECRGEAGRVMPLIDRNRCEAKAACVELCPFEVFEIRPLAQADRAGLSLRGKLKAWGHGHRQAYVIRPADCHACQLCVKACPEEAIRLVPYVQG